MKQIIYLILCTLISTASAGAQTPAPVVTPAVPQKVNFAGVDIDLTSTNMYERYDRELTALAYTHGTTLLTLKRANKLRDEIIPIIEDSGLPADLFYIACIESNLDPTAISPAKAGGLWQLMPATARELGLEVNDNVDERFHTAKATRAACRYLKNAYARFGKWESVAAAYNAGPARITRELDAQHVESAYDLFLNNETSRYIFRLLAMKEIFEHPERYGYKIDTQRLYQPEKYTEVQIDSTITSWPDWAAEQGTNYLSLRRLNPWIRSRQLPNPSGKSYTLRLPVTSTSRREQ